VRLDVGLRRTVCGLVRGGFYPYTWWAQLAFSEKLGEKFKVYIKTLPIFTEQ